MFLQVILDKNYMNKNQKQNIKVLSMAAFALVALALTPIILNWENASAVIVIHKKHPFHHKPFHKHHHVIITKHQSIIKKPHKTVIIKKK